MKENSRMGNKEITKEEIARRWNLNILHNNT
jgi:hypothetical protein